MKLNLKKSYIVNGIEYDSLQDAKKAVGIVSTPKKQKSFLSKIDNKISLFNVRVSECMGRMNLLDAKKLSEQMSNENIKFWIPSKEEIILWYSNNKIDDWNNSDFLWTSTNYKFSRFLIFNPRFKEFEDMFNDIKFDVRFFFKENLL